MMNGTQFLIHHAHCGIYHLTLRERGEAFVERVAQAVEVRVEGNEACALEEGAPARLVGDAVERALPEAHGRLIVACQADRRRVEGIARDVALLDKLRSNGRELRAERAQP